MTWRSPSPVCRAWTITSRGWIVHCAVDSIPWTRSNCGKSCRLRRTRCANGANCYRRTICWTNSWQPWRRGDLLSRLLAALPGQSTSSHGASPAAIPNADTLRTCP
ncbi:unnamed protein product [Leptidea sinapis]|uniref:Uncharacterized protein n=1 Tax=Leptidea sinapis TaxID=189913 RepID=A0A5E4QH14_9NEOP|nr:unnamed protein product [Leptidea sinapis]